jgi:hypothetical protein
MSVSPFLYAFVSAKVELPLCVITFYMEKSIVHFTFNEALAQCRFVKPAVFASLSQGLIELYPFISTFFDGLSRPPSLSHLRQVLPTFSTGFCHLCVVPCVHNSHITCRPTVNILAAVK